MLSIPRSILTFNGGSSSIKFALFSANDLQQRIVRGQIERIGLPGTQLVYQMQHEPRVTQSIVAPDYHAAAACLLDWLGRELDMSQIAAAGHRVVHGMQHQQHERITPELLSDLQRISIVDPEHLPGEILLMQRVTQRYPRLPQFACFDTAFHSQMPRVAKLLPIPRRFETRGIMRYGFHGLSYAFIAQELDKLNINNELQNKTIIAHLGNGSSLAALLDGRSMDTSMGYTPTGGVMMGTRTGDLDPGAAWQMMQSEQLTPQQFNHMVNHESGLKGIAETSPDMRELLAHEEEDVRAAEAIELYCYQIKKCIGAYAAVLGGIDVLVFSGGIGEHAPEIRERICTGLEFLGINIDPDLNEANAPVISRTHGRVTVHVMHTDEELMIARSVYKLLAADNQANKQ